MLSVIDLDVKSRCIQVNLGNASQALLYSLEWKLVLQEQSNLPCNTTLWVGLTKLLYIVLLRCHITKYMVAEDSSFQG